MCRLRSLLLGECSYMGGLAGLSISNCLPFLLTEVLNGGFSALARLKTTFSSRNHFHTGNFQYLTLKEKFEQDSNSLLAVCLRMKMIVFQMIFINYMLFAGKGTSQRVFLRITFPCFISLREHSLLQSSYEDGVKQIK